MIAIQNVYSVGLYLDNHLSESIHHLYLDHRYHVGSMWGGGGGLVFKVEDIIFFYY